MPERILWIEVIKRATFDALKSRGELKMEALHWFYSNSVDYRNVCYFAGVNPDVLRKDIFNKQKWLKN